MQLRNKRKMTTLIDKTNKKHEKNMCFFLDLIKMYDILTKKNMQLRKQIVFVKILLESIYFY